MSHARSAQAFAMTMLVGVAVMGCASSGPYVHAQNQLSADETVTLRVRNNYWQDVRVYLLRGGGSPVRLGYVSGMGSATLRIRHPLNGHAQLLLRPLGTRATFITDAVVVQPGERLELTVQTSLNQTVLIRR